MAHELGRLRDELRFEPVAQRIRVRHGAHQVADTTGAMLVWEARQLVPSYAVPLGDLDAEATLHPHEPPDPRRLPAMITPDDPPLHPGPGQLANLRVGDVTLEDIGFVPDDADLAGYVVLSWRPFTWIEEDTEVIGHPHDPFKRIDVLASSRHVRVTLEGTVLADSHRPRLLLETHLPLRWYLPREDVLGELERSDHHTTCAYKGVASYLTLSGHDSGRDIAWYYPDPLHDAEPVRDLVCFWSERTDLELDGVSLPRPTSPFAAKGP
jgi:uncharacterized protein (DUF427 family)